MAAGYFVTFEGIEGCGKSTQANYLYQYLKAHDYDAVITHEPGATPVGLLIRDILLKSKHLTSLCELFLFMADRCQHLDEIIRPALAKGNIVICDRFHHSTLAYQAGGRHLDENIINDLNAIAVRNTVPNLTFLIDVPPEVGIRRKKASHPSLDRIEQESLDFHNSVRDSYIKMSRNDSTIVLIDGTGKKEEIRDKILAIFKKNVPMDLP